MEPSIVREPVPLYRNLFMFLTRFAGLRFYRSSVLDLHRRLFLRESPEKIVNPGLMAPDRVVVMSSKRRMLTLWCTGQCSLEQLRLPGIICSKTRTPFHARKVPRIPEEPCGSFHCPPIVLWAYAHSVNLVRTRLSTAIQCADKQKRLYQTITLHCGCLYTAFTWCYLEFGLCVYQILLHQLERIANLVYTCTPEFLESSAVILGTLLLALSTFSLQILRKRLTVEIYTLVIGRLETK